MQQTRSKPYSLYLFLLFSAGFVLCVSLANGPDQSLSFKREVPSVLDPSRYERIIGAPNRWPQWFFSLGSVEILGEGANPQPMHVGSLLQLNMAPKKLTSKAFALKVKITEYSPGRVLKMQIVEDSSQRLTRLFDRLEWKIEILPHPKGSLILGTASAHTSHWRSRLFGRLSERILMNQTFYPDLLKLSELTQPFSTPDPQSHLPPNSVSGQ